MSVNPQAFLAGSLTTLDLAGFGRKRDREIEALLRSRGYHPINPAHTTEPVADNDSGRTLTIWDHGSRLDWRLAAPARLAARPAMRMAHLRSGDGDG